MSAVYETSAIKPRSRRGKADIAKIRERIRQLLEAEQPMTVRQVFYRLVACRAIEKSEAQYKTTVCRLLKEMRKAGEIPFDWIADNTRWMRKPNTFDSVDEVLRDASHFYRRDLWQNQGKYVEIWLEKEALSGVIDEITYAWHTPLMVTRGYPSLSFLFAASEAIKRESGNGKEVYLYYFGDRDPSGVDIPRFVEQQLREFAPNASVHFECVAVTEEQIDQFQLETRPTKKTDSRSRDFKGESVELDAIPPNSLRELVNECIEQHIDRRALNQLRNVEHQEREIFERMRMVGVHRINGLLENNFDFSIDEEDED